jgi:hypothetical protein
MLDQPAARPIFIIGSERSGASLLALALGQHANLVQSLETNWFGRFSLGLRHAYAAGLSPRETSQLDVAEIDIETFFLHFGDAIDRLMLTMIRPHHDAAQPQRWIDASRSNVEYLFELRRLFPQGKFIHVLRDASQVVASLSTPENRKLYRSRYVKVRPEVAAVRWQRTVKACVEAERAFGSDVVLRVRRQDLVQHPEEELRRCLAFIGEPFDPACLRPFRPLTRLGEEPVSASLPVVDGHYPVDEAIALVSSNLLDEELPACRADDEELARMEMSSNRRWMREHRALTGGRDRQTKKPTQTGWREMFRKRLPVIGGRKDATR